MEHASASREDPTTLLYLTELSKHYPNSDVALGKIARMKAELTLPKGTIHVISDVHGEFKKLKHVINNASGSLRLLVQQTFANTLSSTEYLQLLNLIYYPRETFTLLETRLEKAEVRREFLEKVVSQEVQLLRALGRRYTLEGMERVFPEEYREFFRELLLGHDLSRSSAYTSSMLNEFLSHGKELDLLRLIARMIRNLLISELIVAGDLGDRGERIDKVIEYLMRQPRVSITWGNHDAIWMGACLGDQACIATVLRFSLRYGRMEQLEEGYGIPLRSLEVLAETEYRNDPADRFVCKGESSRSPELLARMQKAISIIQLKLEGQAIKRNPQFRLEERLLLHQIEINKGVIRLDGITHELLDKNFPTVSITKDPDTAYALTSEESRCMDQLRESFLSSPVLWRHMTYVARQGSNYLLRDKNLIFHACLPVSPQGEFLELEVDGEKHHGKALFDALTRVVHRAFREKRQSDLDMLWYLWSGPRSPWFGKDKMATFEGYFIGDKTTHKEHNNSYFSLIHETDFAKKVLREFGIDSDNGLIVNGHVPVKIDQGESPVKRSGLAVTIDGAFSEAYGDNGYTLVLDSTRTSLAQHHHFESVADAITQGADIIPTIQDIRIFKEPHTVADTEEGVLLRRQIALLELLIEAFNENQIAEVRP